MLATVVRRPPAMQTPAAVRSEGDAIVVVVVAMACPYEADVPAVIGADARRAQGISRIRATYWHCCGGRAQAGSIGVVRGWRPKPLPLMLLGLTLLAEIAAVAL